MSQTIYKYELQSGITTLKIPMNAQILTAACQGDSVFIWAKLRPKNPLETRTFEVYGNDHEIPELERQLAYIGTAMMHGGALVWHVFERRP